MQPLFIDCNEQLGPVFAHVHDAAQDPPIEVNTAPFKSADLPRLLAGRAVCLIDHSYLPTDIAAQCDALRHVVFLGTGAASYMDVAALAGRKITVHTIRGYGDRAVAEHATALMFAAARQLAAMDREVRAGQWRPREGRQLAGAVLGIVGLGGIGRAMASIGQGLGMEVLAWNRTPRAVPGVAMMELDEVVARADVLSLHLTLDEATTGLLNEARLAGVRPGCILINTARAALVDEAALLAALRSGRLGHAALDVFHEEPLAADHPFLAMENVTLSAHAGFRTAEASQTLLRRAIDIVRAILDGAPAGG